MNPIAFGHQRSKVKVTYKCGVRGDATLSVVIFILYIVFFCLTVLLSVSDTCISVELIGSMHLHLYTFQGCTVPFFHKRSIESIGLTLVFGTIKEKDYVRIIDIKNSNYWYISSNYLYHLIDTVTKMLIQLFNAIYSYQEYYIARQFSGSMSILFWNLYPPLLEIRLCI